MGYFKINSGSGGGGNISPGVVIKTLAEFNNLIVSNTLVPGTTYRINGIDGNFCDGFFVATTNNTFNPNGVGLFQNPNYGLYQLWRNQFYSGVTVSVGVPLKDQVYTNGVQSFIWKVDGLYIANQDTLPNGTYTSGGKSVTVSGADVQNYAINDIVIFGNKHWKNVNGNLGAKINELTLNAEWVQVTTNTLPVIDEIVYDIANDWVSTRKDDKGNEITLSKSQSDNNFGDNFNYVKTFSWGILNSSKNKITNWFGVVCNLGFTLFNNTGNDFFFAYNTGNDFTFSNNSGNTYNFNGNTGNSYTFSNNSGNTYNFNVNTGNSYTFSNNSGNNYNFNGNTGNDYTVSDNSGIFFQLGSNIGNSYTFSNNSGNNYNIYSNIFDNLNLSENSGNNFYFSSNTGNNITIQSNTGNKFYLQQKNLLSKTISNCFFQYLDISSTTDISSATHLFNFYPKQIFFNSAAATVVSYVNGSNVQVITGINT